MTAANTNRGRPRGRADMPGKARRVRPGQELAYLLRMRERIRDTRLELGISPSELGEAVGVSSHTICRIEAPRAGKRDCGGVSIPLLIRVAIALGVMPSELLP